MKRSVSVKRRTRRQRQRRPRKHQKKTRRLSVRRKQHGGESSVDMPLGSIVIERDAGDQYSPFLAVERDTARNELSARSEV